MTYDRGVELPGVLAEELDDPVNEDVLVPAGPQLVAFAYLFELLVGHIFGGLGQLVLGPDGGDLIWSERNGRRRGRDAG